MLQATRNNRFLYVYTLACCRLAASISSPKVRSLEGLGGWKQPQNYLALSDTQPRLLIEDYIHWLRNTWVTTFATFWC
jgi:hypothetical protein